MIRLGSAKNELERGNEGAAVLCLFDVAELSANTYKWVKDHSYVETHQGKYAVAERACANGDITKEELEAYERVRELKGVAQYVPYTEYEGSGEVDRVEAESLFRKIASMANKMKKMAEEHG